MGVELGEGRGVRRAQLCEGRGCEGVGWGEEGQATEGRGAGGAGWNWVRVR